MLSAQAEIADTQMRVRSGFMLRVLAAFVVLALLSAGLAVAGRWYGGVIALAGHTKDKSPREVVIGNDMLSVPANMIRFEGSRRDGAATRLDLYVRWPDMEGYSDAARDDFNHIGEHRNILFVSFEERIMSRDMSGRYEPIYQSLISAESRAGPGGLAVHAFTEESGYVDEVLVVGERPGAEPFVARCLSGEAARRSLAPCERDIHVGNSLNLVYRMPAELAGSWREVDEAVLALAGRLLQTRR